MARGNDRRQSLVASRLIRHLLHQKMPSSVSVPHRMSSAEPQRMLSPSELPHRMLSPSELPQRMLSPSHEPQRMLSPSEVPQRMSAASSVPQTTPLPQRMLFGPAF